MMSKEDERQVQSDIVHVLAQHRLHSSDGLDEQTIRAAVSLLSEIRANEAMLGLIYKGLLVARYNENDEAEFIKVGE